MRAKVLSLFVMLVAVFAFVGCGGGGGSAGVTATVSGTVTDMSGKAIEGATIFNGSNTATTDKDGKYTLTVAVPDAGSASVSGKKSNYAQNTKVVAVTASGTVTQDMKLASVGIVNTDAAGKVTATKGASVELPGSGYKKADGTAYSGKVVAKVTYNRVTTPDGMEAYPGTFLGENTDGSTSGLQSYGFVDTTLEDADGNPLNLDGSTATIKYPLDPSFKGSYPATIPLWHFDVTKGIWIEEGSASYVAPTATAAGYYEGDVGHFSTWNLDAKFDQTTIVGCVQDVTGARVPVADLYLTAPGLSKHVSNNDPQGEFKFKNAPSGLEVSLVAVHDGWASSEFNMTLLQGVDNNTSDGNGTDCLVLDQNASAMFVQVKGKVVDGDDAPIENSFIHYYTKSADANYVFGGHTPTDANGSFSFSFKRAAVTDIKLSTYANSVAFEFVRPVDPAQTLVDVGTLVLATTKITGCVTLESGSSTATNGTTTLTDGTSTVDDGTTVDANGFTSFGTNCRSLFTGAPYGSSGGYQGGYKKVVPAYSVYCHNSFDANGKFEVTLKRDNEAHKIYAHTYDTATGKYTLTGSKDVTTNTTAIDQSTSANECIQLSKMADVNQSATATINSSNTNVGLYISYSDSYSWADIIPSDPKIKTATFNFDRNGKYSIVQIANWDDNVTFNGTMSLVTGDKTHTITIPSTSGGDMWSAFNVEVYNGSIEVKEINSGW